MSMHMRAVRYLRANKKSMSVAVPDFVFCELNIRIQPVVVVNQQDRQGEHGRDNKSKQ